LLRRRKLRPAGASQKITLPLYADCGFAKSRVIDRTPLTRTEQQPQQRLLRFVPSLPARG
jgi:hypothetical protein